MTDIEALRVTILHQTEHYGSKPRFGLFSQPIANAIGDNGQYQTKKHTKGQNGKPITQPRNIYVNPTKLSQLDYFQPLKSLAASDKKDIYMQQRKRLLKQQNQAFSKNRRQSNFVPSSNYKTITNTAYKFEQQNNPQLNPKRNRQDDGKVKSMPRNVYTNSMNKVKSQFFKQPKYISDPYDRAHNHDLQLIKRNKTMNHQSAFKPNSFVPQTLNSQRKVRQLDVEMKKRQVKPIKFNIFAHQGVFRGTSPMKSGYKGLISEFPKYIQDPQKQLKRKNLKPNEKGQFKRMSTSLSKPSPSISIMSARKSFNSIHR